MIIVDKMGHADRAAQLLDVELPNVRKREEDCASKATLMLNFDSTIETTGGFNGFSTSSAHVRADGIKLRYDPGSNTFVAKHAHLQYLSFTFTKENQWSCDTAYAEVGTAVVDVTAKLTDISPDTVYLIQISPNAYEIVERMTGFKGGSDGMSSKGRCAGRQKEPRDFAYVTGFRVTGGTVPFRLKLGASDILTGTSDSFGSIHFTGTTILTLHGPDPLSTGR